MYKEVYEKWLKNVDEETKGQLLAMTEDEISDSFYREMEFGTGGIRGVMGAGTNRMNKYTIRKATQGLAYEILDCGEEEAKRGVAIAYDSRNNSKEFAKECAGVLSANNIKVYLFESLRPTPELSFAVRHLNCLRGIVITASHNPKEYNGYKVYGEDGGQAPPTVADKISSYIDKLDIFEDVKLSEPNYIEIGEDVDKEYIKAVKEQAMGIEIPEDFRIVYTPIHGSGSVPVQRILKEIGVKNLFVVKEQELPDGSFPTVVSPNPENKEALDMSINLAKEVGANIVFGTDPDSDRIGVAVKKEDGEYICLNGNQTGSLLCEFILRKLKENGTLPSNGRIVKTIVTTELVRKIAEAYGIEVIDVLTGFKYIGEQIKEYETSGRNTFIFGLEESYGYLKGTYARDKDAVVASMLICEMAADYYKKGMTLYDGLNEIYKNYGFCEEFLETESLNGEQGAIRIKEIMENLRKNPPSVIGGSDVVKLIDYNTDGTGLPKSNVLKFFLNDGWFAVRPSGTEPKIKFYYGLESKGDKKDKIREEIKRLICEG